ncbi:hypothetical protein, partial [Saccharothrix coeruleofusca]|uniref:hypothetical protein n=1 Tax=Saccharothrix coeruleofusca TaxID=33919 RepID=UPI001E47DB1A
RTTETTRPPEGSTGTLDGQPDTPRRNVTVTYQRQRGPVMARRSTCDAKPPRHLRAQVAQDPGLALLIESPDDE